MEENNKKGFNVLYAVLGVSTLIVAIIGATFAYFSASQTNTNIQGNIAEAGGLVLEVTPITNYYDDKNVLHTTGSSIIPLNLIPNQTQETDDQGLGVEDEDGNPVYVDAESQFADAIANKCIDDLGNNICEVYKIKVTNQSTTATVQVRGTLNLGSDGTNMYWKLINATTTPAQVTLDTTDEAGQPTTTTVDYEVLNTATEIAGIDAVQQGTTGDLTVSVTTSEGENPTTTVKAANVSLAGGASETFYVIVWLEEMGRAQENEDASNVTESTGVRGYNGTVTFDAVDAQGNKSGVTATFNKSTT